MVTLRRLKFAARMQMVATEELLFTRTVVRVASRVQIFVTWKLVVTTLF